MSPPRHRDDRLVRPYVVTGGRHTASRNHLDHVTLISLSSSAAHLSRGHLSPDQLTILQALAHSAQSVAELAAHIGQPVSVTRIVLADLIEPGHITTRQRITDAAASDHRSLLEKVLAGLQKL